MGKPVFYFSFIAALLFLVISCGKDPVYGEIPDPDEDENLVPDGILWGSSFYAGPGETRQAAYTRVKNTFSNHHITRVFCATDPEWPTYLPTETLVQISFKYKPADVLNGSKDIILGNFFSKLATKTTIYWTYFHEPEDEIQKGDFTAKEYRKAFDYIIDLSKKLNKPNLIPTLCLMAYSVKPESGRNWRDYVPGKVELISWDGYYADSYGEDVSKIFGPVREVMKTVNLPWGVAETGVNKRKKQGQVNEDTNIETRKRLLTALARDLSTVGPLPVYVQYFDSAPPQDAAYSDWRISTEAGMVAAWEAGQE